jgi:ankyrin repeat protein
MSKKIRVRPEVLSRLSEAQKRMCITAIHRFSERTSRGAHLEKLHTRHLTQGQLYSLRVNNEIRLIFNPVKRKGEQIWLLIDVFENHQYQELLNKNNNWLSKCIKKTLEITAEEIEKAKDIQVKEDSGIEFHHNQFILLDKHQKKAKASTLPAIFTGAPGSGKSALAVLCAAQYIKQNQGALEQKHRLLILTQSENLSNALHKEWIMLCEYEGLDMQAFEVHFKTPKQLFKEHCAQTGTPLPQLVTQAHFQKWFTKHTDTELNLIKQSFTPQKKKQQQLSPEEQFIADFAKHPKNVYEEFCVMTGYQSFEEYNTAVGGKHSLFTDPKQRDWIWCTYQRYQKLLGENNEVDLFFHPLLVKKRYNLVILDETQDLSRIQLRSAVNIVKQFKLIFNVGDHQKIHGSHTIVPYLKSVFQSISKDIKVTHQRLLASYRCGSELIKLINAMLQIKYHVTTETANKDVLKFVATNEEATEKGSAYWLEKPEHLTPLLNDLNNADFAVITPPEFKTEAQGLFDIERVFTPEESKGLEYKHVLLYRFFECPEYKEINPILDKNFKLHNNPQEQAIPTAPAASIRYTDLCNEGFVSFSRATHSVSVYQPRAQNMGIHQLRSLFKEFIVANNNQTAHAQAIPTQSTDEEWQERKASFKSPELQEQAQAINKKLSPAQEVKSEVSEPTPREVSQSQTRRTSRANSSNTTALAPKSNPAQQRNSKNKSQTSTSSRSVVQEEAHRLIDDILQLKKSSLIPFLKNPKAEEILFDTLIKSPATNNIDTTLAEWIINRKEKQLFIDCIIKLLNEMTASKKKLDIEQVSRLINILCRQIFKKDTMATFFYFLLSSAQVEEKIFVFIRKYISVSALNSVLHFTNDKGTFLRLVINQKNPLFIKNLHLFCDLTTLRDIKGFTAIHYAMENPHIPTIILLSDLGINLDVTDDRGMRPIDHAAIDNLFLACGALACLGVDINAAGDDGDMPLHRAASNGHIKVIEELILRGAKVNASGFKGATPAFRAAEWNQLEALKLLHKHGAKLNQKCALGQTLCHAVAAEGHIEVINFIYENDKELLSVADDNGICPIHFAAANNQIDALIALVKYKVNLNAYDKDGLTVAHILVQNNNIERLIELKKLGLDVSLPNKQGISAIQLEEFYQIVADIERSEKGIFMRLLKNSEMDKCLFNMNTQSNKTNENITLFEFITQEDKEKRIIFLNSVIELLKKMANTPENQLDRRHVESLVNILCHEFDGNGNPETLLYHLLNNKNVENKIRLFLEKYVPEKDYKTMLDVQKRYKNIFLQILQPADFSHDSTNTIEWIIENKQQELFISSLINQLNILANTPTDELDINHINRLINILGHKSSINGDSGILFHHLLNSDEVEEKVLIFLRTMCSRESLNTFLQTKISKATLLNYAICSKNTTFIKNLHAFNNLQTIIDDEKWDVIDYALEIQDESIIVLLHELGVDLNVEDQYKETIAHILVRKKELDTGNELTKFGLDLAKLKRKEASVAQKLSKQNSSSSFFKSKEAVQSCPSAQINLTNNPSSP